MACVSPAIFNFYVCLRCMKLNYERPLCGQIHCVMSQTASHYNCFIFGSVAGPPCFGPPSARLPWRFMPNWPERRSAKLCQTVVSERSREPESPPTIGGHFKTDPFCGEQNKGLAHENIKTKA